MTKDLNKYLIGSHIQRAHRTIRGEHQLAQYVSQLGLNECVEILSISEISLASLTTRHTECRVPQDEMRDFEE